MGYQGAKAQDVTNAASVAEAILPHIGFYFNGEYRVMDYEVDLSKQVVYAAVQLSGGTVKAYMFWYVLRNYPDANILFDCDYENCYYEWLKDFPYADCPARILGKLTPTGNITANNWRTACWRNAARRNLNDKDTV